MASPDTFQSLTPDDAQTLVAVMRRIVPHQNTVLQEAVSATALAYEAQLVANVELRREMQKNLRDLDARARQQGAASFAAAPEEVQERVLRAVEGEAWFQSLVHATVSDFYNRHAVWEALGYPGLAQRDGAGYLHKGFDVLNW